MCLHTCVPQASRAASLPHLPHPLCLWIGNSACLESTSHFLWLVNHSFSPDHQLRWQRMAAKYMNQSTWIQISTAIPAGWPHATAFPCLSFPIYKMRVMVTYLIELLWGPKKLMYVNTWWPMASTMWVFITINSCILPAFSTNPYVYILFVHSPNTLSVYFQSLTSLQDPWEQGWVLFIPPTSSTEHGKDRKLSGDLQS